MNSLNKLLFFTDFTVTLRATRRALKLVARALKALMNVYHTVFFIIPALQSEKYNKKKLYINVYLSLFKM
jgi:hypothetical protein